MATRFATRSLLGTKQFLSLLLSRSYTSLSLSTQPSSFSSLSTSSILRLRPLVAVASNFHQLAPAATTVRSFASRQTTSSLNDSNPNWSNRPPKETILLDGCDFEHWLVVMEKPEGDPTRDEIIDSYIKTLAAVVGSEEEARMKIYSVSTRHYFAFGALVSEELSYKIKELPRVRWVLPDSYLDVKNKDYGGEPFINGQAVPYDPKYHEEWVRNNARANERNRRNDRPRNFDRSRNFERRRANMQGGGYQNPMANSDMQNPGPNMGGTPPGNTGIAPHMGGGPPSNMGHQPSMGVPPSHMGGVPNAGGMQPNNMGGSPNAGGFQPNNMGRAPNMGGMPPNNMGGVPNNSTNFQSRDGPNSGGVPYPSREMSGPGPSFQPNNTGGAPNMGGFQPNNMGGAPNMGGFEPNNMGGAPSMGGFQPNNTGRAPNMGGMPPNNMGGMPPNNMGGMPPNNMGGVPNNATNFQSRDGPNSGGMPYPSGEMSGPGPNRGYQNSYPPNSANGNPYQTQNLPGRDAPPSSSS